MQVISVCEAGGGGGGGYCCNRKQHLITRSEELKARGTNWAGRERTANNLFKLGTNPP